MLAFANIQADRQTLLNLVYSFIVSINFHRIALRIQMLFSEYKCNVNIWLHFIGYEEALYYLLEYRMFYPYFFYLSNSF